MSEERLQEIKDSVNFQREVLLANNMGTLCVDEEQELVEEIERLNKELEIEKANKEAIHNSLLEEQDRSMEYHLKLSGLNNIITRINDKCNYLLNNEKVIINGKEYIKQNADDVITNYIMEELKGSDKE